MTDRINALLVVLNQDIREDDIEPLMRAIEMLRGVLEVTPRPADITDAIAFARANQAWQNKLIELVRASDSFANMRDML